MFTGLIANVHFVFTAKYKCYRLVQGQLQMFPVCSRICSLVHAVFTGNFKCSRLVHADVLLFTPCSRAISNVHAMFTPIFPRSRQCSRVHVSFTPFLVFTHVPACLRAWIGNVNVAGIVHNINYSVWHTVCLMYLDDAQYFVQSYN